MTGEPRTNGFLFADLRDYTRFVEAHGDQAAAALLQAYRVLVRHVVARFGGAEIKTEGDSFYVVFPSASSAVQCGLAILEGARTAAPDGGPIKVGVGVHAGETVETDEGYVGSAVNIAARVCSQAKAGELLVTDTVRGLTRTSLPVRYESRGRRQLKGISEPLALYAVQAGAAPAPSTTRPFAGRLPLIAAAGGLVFVAAVLGFAMFGPALAGPGTTPSPLVTVPPTAPPTHAAASFPTDAEADLLAHVPSRLRDSCTRTESTEALDGALASLRCELALGDEADRVWFDAFASQQRMASVVEAIITEHRLPARDCEGTPGPPASDTWGTLSTHHGVLVCYAEPGALRLAWTYDADRIVARATRSGDASAWKPFLDWWRQFALFLIPS